MVSPQGAIIWEFHGITDHYRLRNYSISVPREELKGISNKFISEELSNEVKSGNISILKLKLEEKKMKKKILDLENDHLIL